MLTYTVQYNVFINAVDVLFYTGKYAPFSSNGKIYTWAKLQNKKKSFAFPIEYSFLLSAQRRAGVTHDGSAPEFERAEKVPECSVSLQAGLLQRSWVLERY